MSDYSGFIRNELKRAFPPGLKAFQELKALDPEISIVERNGTKMVTYAPEHTQLFPGHPVPIILNPVTFTAGPLNPQTPIQVRIPSHTSSHVEKLYLMVALTNTDASNPVTPSLLPFCFNHIDFFVNGQMGAPICTLQSMDLYEQLEFLDYNDLQALTAHNAMNMSGSTFDTPGPLGVSTTANYVLPLLLAPFRHMNPQTYRQDLIMNVYMRTNPVDSGTGTLIISNLWLYLITADSPVKSAALKELSRIPTWRPFMNPVYQQYTGTLTASTYTDINTLLTE